MRLLAVVCSLFFSMQMFAQGVIAEGKISVKNPEDSAIIPMPIQMELPPRGQGELKLTIHESIELVAESFHSQKKDDRVVFKVLFKLNAEQQEMISMFLQGEHKARASHVLFKGTYARGSNKAIYYGDVFGTDAFPHWKKNYIGGFYVETPIEQSQGDS